MATFKIVIQAHHKKNDGTYNVKIRIIHNRRIKYISTHIFLTDKELTKNLTIKSQQIKDDCEDILRKYRSVCNQYTPSISNMSVNDVYNLIIKKESVNEIDFIAFFKKFIEQLNQKKRYGTANSYTCTLNSLLRFIKIDKMPINDVTTSFLTQYCDFISGLSAKSLYLTNLRAIHNFAKNEYNDEDKGIILIPYSPFKKFKIPKPPTPKKRAIEIDVINQLIALDYKPESKGKFLKRFNIAKDVFLLSFCTFGTNSVDLFNVETYQNGRLIYQRQKTKDRREDNAEISIKIEPEIMAIFEKYRDPKNIRVFNFYNFYASYAVFKITLNEGLKQVSEALKVNKIDFYAARHSWATIARNKAGVNISDIDIALNHVDLSHKMADKYITKDWSLIDVANRKVLDLINFENKKKQV